MPTSAQKPELTTEKAEKLGVKERISTFSTNLTADAGRTENLQIAGRAVDGTLVLPGETFSLNEVLGERTPEKGYNPAPAISGGRLVKDYGGGVSQMATTIFNNVFFAGLEDVYHKPHSFYISRYPEGREATVNWPTVDLKWKNDTKTAVLIKASVGSQVTVSFYGTKYWDITAGKSERSNLRSPETHYDDSPGCVAQGANGGFDVSITRTFRRPGSDKVEKTETFKAVYNAEDEVICGPEPGSRDDQDRDKPPAARPGPATGTEPGGSPGVERGDDRLVDRAQQRRGDERLGQIGRAQRATGLDVVLVDPGGQEDGGQVVTASIARRCTSSSIPLISGIVTSRMATSGRPRSDTACSAVWAEVVPITRCPFDCSLNVTIRTVSGSSSTTSTRAITRRPHLGVTLVREGVSAGRWAILRRRPGPHEVSPERFTPAHGMSIGPG